MQLTTIKSEGSLISADLIEEIRAGTAIGQKSTDFGLNGKVRLTDEIAACWSDARAFWDAFNHSIRRLKEDESTVSETRNQWILPLLKNCLGFDNIRYSGKADIVYGQSFTISHRNGPDFDGFLVDFDECMRRQTYYKEHEEHACKIGLDH